MDAIPSLLTTINMLLKTEDDIDFSAVPTTQLIDALVWACRNSSFGEFRIIESNVKMEILRRVTK